MVDAVARVILPFSRGNKCGGVDSVENDSQLDNKNGAWIGALHMLRQMKRQGII
jgi:hypothetical protein